MYSEFIKIPLGDKIAREELEKPNPDLSVARAGFIQAKNNPEDTEGMSLLFIRFRNVSYIDRAIDIWERGDGLIQQLQSVADEAHEKINNGSITEENISSLLSEIKRINEEATILEEDFSSALGDASRWANKVIISAVIAVGTFFLIIELLLSVIVARSINSSVDKINKAVLAFKNGRLDYKIDVNTKDELGALALAFNDMSSKLSASQSELNVTNSQLKSNLEELAQNKKYLTESNQLLTKQKEELIRTNERLHELDNTKSEFISVAAHQLRTPLSAVKWILALLTDEGSDNLTPAQKSLVMKGYESNERMINLVNDMLVVTRIESGKIQYNFAPAHIEDIIESVILDFAGQAYVRKIKLTFDKAPNQLSYVNVDSDKIRDVVQNLIENALKYSNDDGSISVSTIEEGGFIKVMIKDGGIGIPEHQQASIFNKFFRADNAFKRQTDGSGLGLFVAKSIVEKHGGRIGFESIVGKGTVFYFTLPAVDIPT